MGASRHCVREGIPSVCGEGVVFVGDVVSSVPRDLSQCGAVATSHMSTSPASAAASGPAEAGVEVACTRNFRGEVLDAIVVSVLGR